MTEKRKLMTRKVDLKKLPRRQIRVIKRKKTWAVRSMGEEKILKEWWLLSTSTGRHES